MMHSVLSDLPGRVAGLMAHLRAENPVLLAVTGGLILLWLILTLPRP